MPPVTLDSLLEQALTLSVRDRELLANRLYVSLEPAEGTPEEIAAAWHQEIHDRLDQYDRGETKAFTWDECQAGMDAALARAIPADVVFAELTARLASRKK